jgi:hypothetical protein
MYPLIVEAVFVSHKRLQEILSPFDECDIATKRFELLSYSSRGNIE